MVSLGKGCNFSRTSSYKCTFSISVWFFQKLIPISWTKYIFILTHYQTTNFRLFQTKKVCRRQFQIWKKWQKVIQTGRKHCGKRRNCSLRAISPFPTVFTKGLFPRGVKSVVVWEWVNFFSAFSPKSSQRLTYYQMTILDWSKLKQIVDDILKCI